MGKRRALITGANGQDGSYLTELLLAQDYEVFGVDKFPQPAEFVPPCQLTRMDVIDLAQPGLLGELVREVKPDEVYHLAAHHFSSQTDDNRLGRLEPFVNVNLLAANTALEAIANDLPGCRFFYAASAQAFGRPSISPQNEETPYKPETPYAISKCAGIHLCRYFRQAQGVFASVGILYNHESPRRGPSFITTVLARAAALASWGEPEPLVVRDLEAVVDWGAAQDYVRAMWLMLQQDKPDEYVVASGKGRTVRDFAEQAFAYVGLSPEGLVRQDPAGGHTAASPLVGDSAKLQSHTGWRAVIAFEDMVAAMVAAQQQTLRQDHAR